MLFNVKHSIVGCSCFSVEVARLLYSMIDSCEIWVDVDWSRSEMFPFYTEAPACLMVSGFFITFISSIDVDVLDGIVGGCGETI